jgi:hypothetical protein
LALGDDLGRDLGEGLLWRRRGLKPDFAQRETNAIAQRVGDASIMVGERAVDRFLIEQLAPEQVGRDSPTKIFCGAVARSGPPR